MSRREIILIGLLITLAVLLLTMLVRSPLLYRAAPGSSRAGLETKMRSPSITYEVFKPVIDPYNQLVDFFVPSNLKRFSCDLLPTHPDRLPFNMLFGLGRDCY